MFELPKIYESEEVLTVEQLIEILKRYPANAEVWIGTRDGLSNELTSIWPLNAKNDHCDVILGSRVD